jgi:hypothetical protein
LAFRDDGPAAISASLREENIKIVVIGGPPDAGPAYALA